MLLPQTNFGSTFVHNAAAFGSSTLMTKILEELPQSLISRLFEWNTSSHRTLLHAAVLNFKHTHVIILLLQFILDTYAMKGKSGSMLHSSALLCAINCCASLWCLAPCCVLSCSVFSCSMIS